MASQQALIRDAKANDVRDLAQIWYDGWQDAHADLLPSKLAQHRTFDSFRDRLARALGDVRVAVLAGELVGFGMVKNDELYQLYVAPAGRGSGIAASLNADALARIRKEGFRVAWLACAIGNMRAARFYEKSGWRYRGTMTSELETPEGTFTLEVWRYEIHLSGRS
ncbi:GNAT family N-acetyltransferase [Eilatimonas milleporae]|uniref:Acetyltransferase (GNAT) family protein n=1 Tax=Eilatimonas milleporae TaxID=911205 RepID=A0A3M0C0W3_9PROT|nr:GNAT family N-acetyltransferase [Eilatimonas milleporae]RMB01970.1 acetyltransferase (GNAT) family protein [Eilatimonas milleporae]